MSQYNYEIKGKFFPNYLKGLDFDSLDNMSDITKYKFSVKINNVSIDGIVRITSIARYTSSEGYIRYVATYAIPQNIFNRYGGQLDGLIGSDGYWFTELEMIND